MTRVLSKMLRRLSSVLWIAAMWTASAQAEPVIPFDHSTWNDLLQHSVRWTAEGQASSVDYRAMAADKAKLQAYLGSVSAVSGATFDHWPRDAQLAFLINAYNAFTVQFILTRYPDLASIKDLGSLFQSPWKKPFVPLLGRTLALDDVEHGLIRGSGRFSDPRIHFAVNCASIGCPALRPEAYTPQRLDAQLEDQAKRFLGDRTRNRLTGSELEISPIFKWYREDFERGFRGDKTLQDFLARYASVLGITASQAQALRSGVLSIGFGDYDWRLNDGRR